MHYKPGPKLQKFIDSVDLEYPFHPDTYLFPFLKWEDFLALGKDILKNGLKSKIELLKGEIIDGRHRYLACIKFEVVPEFKDLPEDTRPMSHVVTQNFHRRHLTIGQRCNLGLEILKEERIKAKKRKERTQFAGKDKNNKPIRKTSVVTKRGTTEEDVEKGKAHVIAAKKSGLDGKTLIKVEKINEVAKSDEKIQNELNDVSSDERSVEEVYRKVAPKKLNRREDCTFFRAAPCTKCFGQLMACKLDLVSGNLIIKKECPDPCLKYE